MAIKPCISYLLVYLKPLDPNNYGHWLWMTVIVNTTWIEVEHNYDLLHNIIIVTPQCVLNKETRPYTYGHSEIGLFPHIA